MFSWKLIEIENKFYLFKITETANDQIECKISDLKLIWSETLEGNEILARAKHENPRIESTQNQILTAITSSTNNYQIIETETSDDKDEQKLDMQFKIKGYIFGIPFKFHWNLMKCNQVEFLDQITIPLLKAIMDAESQKNDLIQIIRRKDLEIMQYKLEGATLERKTLATPTFEEEEFSKKSKFNSDLLDTLQSKIHEASIKKLCKIDGNSLNSDLHSESSETGFSSVKTATVISPKRIKNNVRPTRKFQGKTSIKLVYDDHDSPEDDKKYHQKESIIASNGIDISAATIDSVAPKKPRLVNTKLNL